jgi:hypothetical protein
MRNVLFGVALAFAAVTGCNKSEEKAGKVAEAPLPTMTVDQVDAQLAAKQITPVDCNGDNTRKKMGVVPGAILISDEDAYAESELPADKTTKLVFYCANPG